MLQDNVPKALIVAIFEKARSKLSTVRLAERESLNYRRQGPVMRTMYILKQITFANDITKLLNSCYWWDQHRNHTTTVKIS